MAEKTVEQIQEEILDLVQERNDIDAEIARKQTLANRLGERANKVIEVKKTIDEFEISANEIFNIDVPEVTKPARSRKPKEE